VAGGQGVAIASPAAIASGAIALDGAIASGAIALDGAAIASPAAIASGAMALDGAIASPEAIASDDMASADIGGQAVDAIASAANTEVVTDISRVTADANTIIEDFIRMPFGMLTLGR
jgi:hypothetical protein